MTYKDYFMLSSSKRDLMKRLKNAKDFYILNMTNSKETFSSIKATAYEVCKIRGWNNPHDKEVINQL